MRLTACILIMALLLNGCGAIMHGTRQDVTINSSPSEAKVYVNGEERTTPAQYNLKRKHNYLIKVSKEGYETAEVMVSHKLDWTAWADLLVWGIIPIFYDLGSGAAWKLTPEEINVSLSRTEHSSLLPEKIDVSLTFVENEIVAHSNTEGIILEIEEIE